MRPISGICEKRSAREEVVPYGVSQDSIGNQSTTTEASKTIIIYPQFAYYLRCTFLGSEGLRFDRALQSLVHAWALCHTLQFLFDEIGRAHAFAGGSRFQRIMDALRYTWIILGTL